MYETARGHTLDRDSTGMVARNIRDNRACKAHENWSKKDSRESQDLLDNIADSSKEGRIVQNEKGESNVEAE